MSNVTSLRRKPRLRIVGDDASTERVFGSAAFIAIGRKPELASPTRFEPTRKGAGDVII